MEVKKKFMTEPNKDKDFKKHMLDLWLRFIELKHNVTLVSATILAALMIVATFSEKLISTTTIKFLLILIIGIIPISLLDFLSKVDDGERRVVEVLKELGLYQPESRNIFRKIFNTSYLWYPIVILLVAVILVYHLIVGL